jgi:hypothetical protein
MGCNSSLSLHFFYSYLDFLTATLERLVASMVRDFTKISPPQKNAATGNGVQQRLSTAAGNLREKLLIRVFDRKVLFILIQ